MLEVRALMTTHEDIRRICSQLPGAKATGDRFGFAVMVKGKLKGFVWAWLERIEPKKARVPSDQVIAFRVGSLTEKEIILGSNHEKFFTEDHYNGYPAVMVRLSEVEPKEMEDLLIVAWRCTAPASLLMEYDHPTT